MGRAVGWLEGEALDALAALLLAAPSRKLPSDVLCSEDAGAAQYCAKAWEAVKAYEDSHPQARPGCVGAGVGIWLRQSLASQALSCPAMSLHGHHGL